MNIEYFISKRLISAKENKNVFSRPIIRITISAISLSVAIMLLSLSILFGFKQEITDKVIMFGSHIQIKSIQDGGQDIPLKLTNKLEESILSNKEIISINSVINIFGLVKTSDDFLGINLKGVDIDTYNWDNFNDLIIDGKIVDSDSTILISYNIASKLKLDVGDKIRVYFPSVNKDRVNVRPLHVSGIYNTSMSEFDEILTFVSIDKIRKIKRWNHDEVGEIEVFIDDISNLSDVKDRLCASIDDYYNKDVRSVKDIYPGIFEWLELQDINVRVIIILMMLVASMNVVSSVLILILEKTKLIGILKALGSSNWSIRKVFIYNAMYLVFRGLLWGNLFAFLLMWVQYQFDILYLDEATYYMNSIPISFNFPAIFLLNLGTLFVCFVTLIFPSIVITKISPIKAIRFE